MTAGEQLLKLSQTKFADLAKASKLNFEVLSLKDNEYKIHVFAEAVRMAGVFNVYKNTILFAVIEYDNDGKLAVIGDFQLSEFTKNAGKLTDFKPIEYNGLTKFSFKANEFMSEIEIISIDRALQPYFDNYFNVLNRKSKYN